MEGRLLDEVGIEDSDLGWLPGDVVCHRLPEPLGAPLRKQKSEQNRSEKGKSLPRTQMILLQDEKKNTMMPLVQT